MRHPGVSMILATGGTAMVKAAYSSGTPAIGVGPGNAPAWVRADADVEAAARIVVASKAFDHVTYTHLINIKRIAHPLAGPGAPAATPPPDESVPDIVTHRP
jgi:hypothetical protein